MPVLPEVGSMIVPPFFNTPRRSASSIIAMPMRSLIDPPGFARSSLIHTSFPGNSEYRRLRRTCGVLPIVSRMLLTRMGADVRVKESAATVEAGRGPVMGQAVLLSGACGEGSGADRGIAPGPRRNADLERRSNGRGRIAPLGVALRARAHRSSPSTTPRFFGGGAKISPPTPSQSGLFRQIPLKDPRSAV